ncbi:sulfotransferase [Acidisoma cellulosilytica]|uniref:Sulfotransferase n=1 Tax=Acidisoma cellulosilyticum TaxID=2802395 RepID=A0A963Z5Z3_9PROT|nr:sulfotransferase [Acidisoma cellulosilyticum]MCB8883151.1 sulfotransferase [Acidisoma cellulosilyticum]
MSEALQRALAQYQAGAFRDAAEAFGILLTASPGDPDLLRLHGLALVRAGDTDKGLPFLREAHARAPDEPLTALHLALGLHAAAAHREAATLLRDASARMPGQSVPLINLSIVELELGNTAEALQSARQAVAISDDAEAFVALARAATAAGEVTAALDAYKTALRLRPAHADTLVGLAVAQYRFGDFGGAMVTLRAALAKAPGHVLAEANLAALLGLRGEHAEAAARLRSLLLRAPQSLAVKLNLANLLLLDRDGAAALALLEGASPAGREGLHWQAQRAAALHMLGRHQEASNILEQITEPRGDAEIRFLWLEIILAPDQDQRRPSRLARLATLADEEGAALPEHRIITHFNLANLATQEARRADAFEHWRLGHRLLGRMQPFSRAAHADVLAALRDAYSAETLARLPLADNDDAAPVFIVGMPRSGTTLTEQIVSAHHRVHGAGERLDVHTLVRRLAGAPLDRSGVGTLAKLSRQELTELGAAFLNDLHKLAPGSSFILDKMPANWLHLGFLSRVLPGARVIRCTRDPRDIGLSIFRRRFFGYHPYAHDLGDLGWAIAQHEAHMRYWASIDVLPIITIALSDWVEDFDGTLTRLMTFLDLPQDPACTRFYENKRHIVTASRDQVLRPINADGIGRWRQYERQLEPMIAELRAAGLCA